MTRPKNYSIIYYINNNLVFFQSRLAKNHKMMSQLCYKKKIQTFNINNMSDRFW